MKKILILAIFLFVSSKNFGQITMQIFEKDFISKSINNDPTIELPNLSCDSIYLVLKKFEFYNFKNAREFQLTNNSIRLKRELYKRVVEEKRCTEIKENILNDFETIVRNHSTKKDILEVALYFYVHYIKQNDDETHKVGSMIKELLKKKGVKNIRYALDFIYEYRLTEYLYYYWEEFNNEPESNGFSKVVDLISIKDLGDSSKVFNQYTSDLWRLTNKPEKILNEDYLYKLIEFIGRGKFDKKYINELFKLLEYLKKNPNKNKKILWQVDSEFGEMYLELKAVVYRAIRDCVKLPNPTNYEGDINNEKINNLLEWHKNNPNYEIKKGK